MDGINRLDTRIDRLDTRMDRLETRIDRLDTRIDEIHELLHRQTYVIVGAMTALTGIFSVVVGLIT